MGAGARLYDLLWLYGQRTCAVNVHAKGPWQQVRDHPVHLTIDSQAWVEQGRLKCNDEGHRTAATCAAMAAKPSITDSLQPKNIQDVLYSTAVRLPRPEKRTETCDWLGEKVVVTSG